MKKICKICKIIFDTYRRNHKYCSIKCGARNRINNLKNKRFGRLLVLEEAGRNKKLQVLWKCKCSCGIIKIIIGSNLISGISKSCNCLNRELTGKLNKTHGMRQTRFYSIYCSIIYRCNNTKNRDYNIYKNIKCLWKSFEEFRDDMYKSYLQHIKKFGEKNTTIDRIDNNGNYCKENCRWATQKQQARNKRNNHLLTFNKKTLCIAEWAEIFSMPYPLIYGRIQKYKWSPERALTTPVKK